MNKNNKYAYCTVITQDKYIPCLIRQKQRMDYLGCKYPFIVLITENLQNSYVIEKLKQNKIIYKIIPYLQTKNINNSFKYFQDTINIYQVLLLEEYDFILFIEADIIFKINFDFLFNLFIDQKINNPFICFRHNIDSKRLNIDNIFFFVRPNKQIYYLIMDTYKKIHYEADVDILNILFYNCLIIIDDELQIFFDENILHFLGHPKIWEITNIPFLNNFFFKYDFYSFNTYLDMINFKILQNIIQHYEQMLQNIYLLDWENINEY